MSRFLSLFVLTIIFTTVTHTQSRAQTPLPACRYDGLPTAHAEVGDWQRTLLDTIYKLPESYAPDDLAPVKEAGLSSDQTLRALLMNDLAQLLKDAAAAGYPLELQSAYRSYAYQAKTFDYWVGQQGLEAARRSSARPGHSEHQLGTAADFRGVGDKAPWDYDDWAETPAGAWLAANAPRYGFVMSYPKGKESVTCYIYEPWHYRYLGREAAAEIETSGLTLREWLWKEQ